MAIIPINSDINLEDYWQFQPLSVEWLYVMQKLKDSIMAKDADKHCLIGVNAVDGSQMYLLSKKFYTAPTISKATGLSVTALEKNTGVITLKPPKAEGLPAATVDGWGTA